MGAFTKVRNALMSASALKAAARLPPQARCLCAVQLVRSVSPRVAFQSHQHHGSSIFLGASWCAAALVSAALAHDGEEAAAADAAAADTCGLTDVAGVVRGPPSRARTHAHKHARTRAPRHARTRTHSGVWRQDMALCESMDRFLQEGLGFPWFVAKICDKVQTTLKIAFPTRETCVIVDKTIFGRNETTVVLDGPE